jgi:hypothetical protein
MKITLIRIVEWIKKNEVRLFFSSGKVTEVKLPWVKDARKAHIVDGGMGLDPGNGKDVCADTLVGLKGRELLPGRRGFVGS